MSLRVALAFLVASLNSLAAAAQDQSPTPALTGALAELHPNTLVRLHAPPTGRISGHFLSAPVDSVVLRVGQSEHTVPSHLVDSLWVGRRHGGRGALIGGIIGMGVGIGLGAAYSSLCSDGGDSDPCPGMIPLLGLGGGAAGGLLGYLIGSAFTTYHRRVPE